ncbi:FAD-dependent oxidoreductase [Hungatella hathewayi]|uniref:FAD-dependent oxidoreductase n=1 Tax=Hungatella hathewayi TaxID=154046 RepID=UPI0035632FFA
MNGFVEMQYDFIVAGGGLGGICAAIAAARGGIRTALVHNRPVLGGNASSEIRMHICGADHHMSRPDARETGILEEILLENKRRNPEMIYPVFDAVLWEKVHYQKNLDLYLNTQMTEVICKEDRITAICAEQLTTEKKFYMRGKLFLDGTGDGVLGAKAGAEYRIGREGRERYGEALAPEKEDHCTMGNSLMFSARDMGHPVPFIKPFWANTYTEEQLKFRDHSDVTSGYWWIELGGGEYRTIEDAELLRDELLKAVYGVWDHIKNGGSHGAENMELEWVGYLPGKRESRRLIGDYVLTERDCLGKQVFSDTVAYGGWPMDIHTVEGFLNENDDPTVWNKVNGIYPIPYRCLYSRNIKNLFLGGRAISCTHVAFSSTRVMATCAVAGQAAGTAAAMALKKGCTPAGVIDFMDELQQELLKQDCYLPGVKNTDTGDLARTMKVTASDQIEDCLPEYVVNGIARGEGAISNCWRAPLESKPVITLTAEAPISVKQIRLTLDSNLSREITPSINRTVLARQEMKPPSELIRDYIVVFSLEGSTVKTIKKESMGQRLQIIELEDEITCDSVSVRVESTYGSPLASIFEIRLYSDGDSGI